MKGPVEAKFGAVSPFFPTHLIVALRKCALAKGLLCRTESWSIRIRRHGAFCEAEGSNSKPFLHVLPGLTILYPSSLWSER